MTTNIQLTDDELKYLRDTLRSDLQCFYDDPIGVLGFGADPDQPDTPEYRKEATSAEVQRIYNLCIKLGLKPMQILQENVTELEQLRVTMLVVTGELVATEELMQSLNDEEVDRIMNKAKEKMANL